MIDNWDWGMGIAEIVLRWFFNSQKLQEWDFFSERSLRKPSQLISLALYHFSDFCLMSEEHQATWQSHYRNNLLLHEGLMILKWHLYCLRIEHLLRLYALVCSCGSVYYRKPLLFFLRILLGFFLWLMQVYVYFLCHFLQLVHYHFLSYLAWFYYWNQRSSPSIFPSLDSIFDLNGHECVLPTFVSNIPVLCYFSNRNFAFLWI